MPDESAVALSVAADNSYLEAPAGFGKTETIADAISLCGGKQLVLTHTHAGVDSLRKRLKAKGVPARSYRLETISAWCLRFVSAYPSTSQYVSKSEPDWKQVYAGMDRLMKIGAIRQIILASSDGVIVDEYQDCTEAQHTILSAVGEILPLRLVGDPLQGIFGFKGEVLVNWGTSIYPSFAELPALTNPWRWQNHNVELGDWLVETRTRLLSGQQPAYDATCITYAICTDQQDRQKAIYGVRPGKDETVMVLVQMANQAHALAQKMPGFSSMEEIECKDLLKACRNLEGKTGSAFILELFSFVKLCCTNPDQTLDRIAGKIEKGEFLGISKLVPNELTCVIEKVGSLALIEHAEEICTVLSKLKGRRMFRSELFYAMIKTIRLCLRSPEISLWESARQVREKVSHGGRKDVQRLVSRVLLVKGLEYDHVIVVDPGSLTNSELYVALTRARKSLTVIEGSSQTGSTNEVATSIETPVIEIGPQGSLFDL